MISSFNLHAILIQLDVVCVCLQLATIRPVEQKQSLDGCSLAALNPLR